MVTITAASNGPMPPLNTGTKSGAKPTHPPSADAGKTGGGGARDQVTLSPEANTFLKSAGGTTPKLADAGFTFNVPDLKAMNAEMGLRRDALEQRMKQSVFAREALGLGNVEDGGGLTLSGEIGNVVMAAAAKAGIGAPEHPGVLQAGADAQKTEGPSEPQAAPGPGTQGTSMITLHLPDAKGGGQVQMWFNNKGLDQFASLSADTVKSSLLDLMKGGDTAAGINAAIDKGVFGQFMNENTDHHADWKEPTARLAYVDPNAPAGSEPLFMIQSKDRPDYVAQHADELVDNVMKLLKAAKG